MSLSLYADRVDNPENLTRIEEAARVLSATVTSSPTSRVIAVENTPEAKSVYGRSPLRGDVTLAVGNERRGLSKRLLEQAAETIAIPTFSRTVSTLNVAAAAVVAGWYVLHGSGPQRLVSTNTRSRPTILVIGEDHIEVGASLRSAAAFGFQEVLLEDRGAGWFDGPPGVKREARAAARRHKNTIRVHRSTLGDARGFEEVVLALPRGPAVPLKRSRMNHGTKQLVIIGPEKAEVDALLDDKRTTVVSLDLARSDRTPLRFLSSIVLAEISRQIGKPRSLTGRISRRPPTYDFALKLRREGEFADVDTEHLLDY